MLSHGFFESFTVFQAAEIFSFSDSKELAVEICKVFDREISKDARRGKRSAAAKELFQRGDSKSIACQQRVLLSNEIQTKEHFDNYDLIKEKILDRANRSESFIYKISALFFFIRLENLPLSSDKINLINNRLEHGVAPALYRYYNGDEIKQREIIDRLITQLKASALYSDIFCSCVESLALCFQLMPQSSLDIRDQHIKEIFNDFVTKLQSLSFSNLSIFTASTDPFKKFRLFDNIERHNFFSAVIALSSCLSLVNNVNREKILTKKCIELLSQALINFFPASLEALNIDGLLQRAYEAFAAWLSCDKDISESMAREILNIYQENIEENVEENIEEKREYITCFSKVDKLVPAAMINIFISAFSKRSVSRVAAATRCLKECEASMSESDKKRVYAVYHSAILNRGNKDDVLSIEENLNLYSFATTVAEREISVDSLLSHPEVNKHKEKIFGALSLSLASVSVASQEKILSAIYALDYKDPLSSNASNFMIYIIRCFHVLSMKQRDEVIDKIASMLDNSSQQFLLYTISFLHAHFNSKGLPMPEKIEDKLSAIVDKLISAPLAKQQGCGMLEFLIKYYLYIRGEKHIPSVVTDSFVKYIDRKKFQSSINHAYYYLPLFDDAGKEFVLNYIISELNIKYEVTPSFSHAAANSFHLYFKFVDNEGLREKMISALLEKIQIYGRSFFVCLLVKCFLTASGNNKKLFINTLENYANQATNPDQKDLALELVEKCNGLFVMGNLYEQLRAGVPKSQKNTNGNAAASESAAPTPGCGK
ncbi:MAG: hypothetical protein V4496_05400 [Pseudomonadota bacterium]